MVCPVWAISSLLLSNCDIINNRTVAEEGNAMYRILIVEDDTVIAKTIKQTIETWGYEVENVTNFKDVLSDFISFDPQLVLLDISLPFYNGYHWCAEISESCPL